MRLLFTEEAIGDKGAKIIAEFLRDNKSVEGLDIGGENAGIGPEGMTAIAEILKTNTTLKTLDVS